MHYNINYIAVKYIHNVDYNVKYSAVSIHYKYKEQRIVVEDILLML